MTIQDLLDKIEMGVLDKRNEIFWSDYDKEENSRPLIKIGNIEILNGYVVIIPGDK